MDEREQRLRARGQQREKELHRQPTWCMDQLVSGSGFYPPRLLQESEFTAAEIAMIAQLESLLANTGHAADLARDLLALKIYNVDVKIIVDDSGSMSLPMLPGSSRSSERWSQQDLAKVFGRRAFGPGDASAFAGCPMGPGTQRWAFLQYTMAQWQKAFAIMGLQPEIVCLNSPTYQSARPGGGTPMGRTLARVVLDAQGASRPTLVLALTDGEANDESDFNLTLDRIQDGRYGDVQVCLVGLSLEKEDIEWFEDEECDDTRVRTVEPWEIEQQRIIWQQVIQMPVQYSFDMHVFRPLVTNYFPADYDYAAPLQTMRHRLYISLHALDRRYTGCRNNTYRRGSVDPAGCPQLYAAGLILLALNAQSHMTMSLLGGAAMALCGGAGMAYTRSQQNSQAIGMPDWEEDFAKGGPDDVSIGMMIRTLQTNMTRGSGDAKWAHIRRAIGALQPSEFQSRELQYNDKAANKQALQCAIYHLRQAAQA